VAGAGPNPGFLAVLRGVGGQQVAFQGFPGGLLGGALPLQQESGRGRRLSRGSMALQAEKTVPGQAEGAVGLRRPLVGKFFPLIPGGRPWASHQARCPNVEEPIAQGRQRGAQTAPIRQDAAEPEAVLTCVEQQGTGFRKGRFHLDPAPALLVAQQQGPSRGALIQQSPQNQAGVGGGAVGQRKQGLQFLGQKGCGALHRPVMVPHLDGQQVVLDSQHHGQRMGGLSLLRRAAVCQPAGLAEGASNGLKRLLRASPARHALRIQGLFQGEEHRQRIPAQVPVQGLSAGAIDVQHLVLQGQDDGPGPVEADLDGQLRPGRIPLGRRDGIAVAEVQRLGDLLFVRPAIQGTCGQLANGLQ